MFKEWRDPVQRKKSTRHLYCSLILALTMISVTFGVLAVSANAQEVKTDNQQQASEPVQQNSLQAQEGEPATLPQASSRPFRLAWDTTTKYSNAFRVQSRSNTLINPAVNPLNGNQDDGDRDFKGGLISDRLDVLSEIDLTYKSHYGIRASAAAWGDQVYHGTNDNNSPDTVNAYTVNYNQFTEGTRDIEMAHIELLDAFAFGKYSFGKESSISFRGGQFAQQYGESLFFGGQGIAGGMSPIDLTKLLAVPSSQFKEIIRPVPQISMDLQINSKISIGGYYQLGWSETRFPAVGSYFSVVDILGAGAERLVTGFNPMVGPHGLPTAFVHSTDLDPKTWGQFGGQLKVQAPHGVDLGFYAIQFHEKAGQLYLSPFILGPPVVTPSTFEIGTFNWVYPENVKAFGASATKTYGNFNWAIELSGRVHQDLTADGSTITPFIQADNNHHPQYAMGDAINGQISFIASVPPNFIAKEASWAGELAWNELLSITSNPQKNLDPNTTKNAVGFRTVYEPVYRQWKPGADLSFPVGFAFFPMGKSAVYNSFGPDKGGDYTVGIALAFRDVWRFGLSFNGYYGTAAGFLDANNHYAMKQDMADRDFVAFSVRRTFGVRAAH
ncbi:MAG: DUF1302 family protein [Candidatus Korobacteraceae bacterium]